MDSRDARHSVSVAGVVTDGQGRALLIRRRDTRHWEPLGGALELRESIQAGLCREVREETGLTVRPVALTGVYKNMTRGIIALVFRCEVRDGRLAISDEVCGFQWATAERVVHELQDDVQTLQAAVQKGLFAFIEGLRALDRRYPERVQIPELEVLIA